MNKLNPKQANVLSVFIALNAWGQNEIEAFQTQSGRSLYYQLAQTMLDTESTGGGLLKQGHGRVCERAIRGRIRKFQKAGLLVVKCSHQDRRAKQIVPTEKFVKDLSKQLDHCIGLLENRYLLIEK